MKHTPKEDVNVHQDSVQCTHSLSVRAPETRDTVSSELSQQVNEQKIACCAGKSVNSKCVSASCT
jgi:hypothetical protein